MAAYQSPAIAYLPRTPTDPPEPCPELLTQTEAIRYLRIDTTGVKNPDETLKLYRDAGRLRATRVGRCLFYRRVELERFLERQTLEG